MKKIYLVHFFLISLILLLFLPSKSSSTPLTVSYFERPPYYFTKQDRAAGFLIELSRKIFQDAGIEVVFISLPPARIIKAIKNADNPHCSIGWFKKPEREKFAKFSLPIYQNQPVVLLTSKKFKELFLPYKTLQQVFSDKTLIMGKMSSFSYGSYVDDLLTRIAPSSQTITKCQSILIKLIDKGRISYMLAAPEEIPTLITSADLKHADFHTHNLTDIPHGNIRYLIFSQAVQDEVIGRINLSIRKIIPQKESP
ncbi:MAG: transporter substrate-binding domain-containing protein [Candidatus Aegiribacteria sp.]|nr:transporter substrate-binding domain-containing protein [Candidatus Aegiribacteria sp.]